MEKVAAIYARVSSNQQKEQQTIQSQTAALVEYAKTHGYMIPSAWQFQDDGYSGATLVRPGLEAIRDLAATGQITAVLVYSPDRLSRKYAYQVVLAEEFARAGVELVFLQAPSAATAEDQLLLQFQGMIAEYERAQIAERSRRGKRHRALQGCVNVLSAAGYGYRYVKKTDVSTAYYQVVNTEAEFVRMMFDWYTRQGFSIEAITRELNQRRIPTLSGRPWLRSTVWGMLRNPAYCGRACFGKSQARKPQHINRRTRQRGGLVSRHGSGQERLSLTKTLCTLLRMSFPKAPPRSSNRSNSSNSSNRLPTCSSVVKEIRRCTLVKGAYLGDRCQSRAKAVRSTVAWGLFRRPVVRSGGAVR